MSLILEALKKSEQQRRLGEAPTLASPVVATRRRRSVLPVLIVLIVVAAAAAWWLMRRHGDAPGPVPSSGNASAVAGHRPGPPVAKPPARPLAAAPGPASASQKRDERLREARIAAREGQEKRQASGAVDARRRAPAEAEATRQVPPADTSAATSAAAKPAPPAPAQPPAAAKKDAPAAPGGIAAAPKPAPVPAKPRPATPALPMVWELPYATRKDLPAIELTMHVYSPDPENRFVVIKGERHVEGDELADGLVLDEIRRDGMVLDYKGKKFLYPRGGR